jgi:hypothetical protein
VLRRMSGGRSTQLPLMDEVSRLFDAPASYPMVGTDLDEGRFFRGAVLHRYRTAGMEAASAGGFKGLGTSPGRMMRSRFKAGSGIGSVT